MVTAAGTPSSRSSLHESARGAFIGRSRHGSMIQVNPMTALSELRTLPSSVIGQLNFYQQTKIQKLSINFSLEIQEHLFFVLMVPSYTSIQLLSVTH